MAKQSVTPNWLGRSVPLTLTAIGPDGQPQNFSFKLCLNFNALALIEERTGIPMTNPVRLFVSPSATNIRVALWAAIQNYHADEHAGDEGLEFVGSLLTFRNSAAAIDAVWEAFLLSVDDKTADKLREAVEAAKRAKDAGKSTDPTPAQAAQ